MPDREFLRRRNALWARLRPLSPGSPEFGAALADLAAHVGWTRGQVLAGLGLTEADLGEGQQVRPEPPP
ncbi:hypothetical protein QOL99_07750 [Deinococcus sp. MIMF12]|uniref:Uncharacterized protein n=1 Tax=Deinococcus rhizophilus TaxID=3049544 RepID=A0ABT7JK62_9DEIO|nr:hypothetical protein [Deinococcus rhizophilus]MDL2344044.1 hypothetical protein [Deinococcus rhizophilus]